VTVKDLIVKMASDPRLAESVIADPAKYQKEYGLSTNAVASLKGLKKGDLATLARPKDPQSFAEGAVAAGRVRTGSLAGDICYYGG
jgi:hypothetical protein